MSSGDLYAPDIFPSSHFYSCRVTLLHAELMIERNCFHVASVPQKERVSDGMKGKSLFNLLPISERVRE